MSDAPRTRGPNYAGLLIPFGLLAAALIAWTVWWFVVANRVGHELDAAAARLRHGGWQVSWSARSVKGWPFRTYVKVKDLRVLAPTGFGVQASELGAEAETYALRKWVIAAPRGLVVDRGPKGAVNVSGTAVRASIVADGSPPHVAIELLDPVFTPLPGSEPFALASAKTVDAYLRPKKGSAGDGEFLLRVVDGKARPGGPLDWITQGAPLSSQWEGTLRGAAGFGAGEGWAKAVQGWSARGGAVTGLHGEARAGVASAEARSERLSVGSDGRVVGAVDLNLKNGPAALTALARSPGVNSTAATAAAAGAPARGGLNGTADVRLVFQNGDTHIGPLRLAPAPRVW